MINTAGYEQKSSCNLVCRPNRTKIRKFTTRDLKRISKSIVDGGASPIEVLVVIVVALGFGALFCKIASAFRFVSLVKSAVESITSAIAASVLLNLLLKALGGTIIKILPIVRLVTGVYALQELMFAAFGRPDQGGDVIDFLEVSAFIDEICEKVHLNG